MFRNLQLIEPQHPMQAMESKRVAGKRVLCSILLDAYPVNQIIARAERRKHFPNYGMPRIGSIEFEGLGLPLLVPGRLSPFNLFIFNNLHGTRPDWQTACTEVGVLMCLHWAVNSLPAAAGVSRRVVS